MASTETSQKRRSGQSCTHCRKRRRRCFPSESDPGTCAKCYEAKIECSLSGSSTTQPRDTKRKIEELGNIHNRDSFRPTRASSSTTVSHNPQDLPFVPPSKKSRRNIIGQSTTTKTDRILAPNKKQNISFDDCGICLKEEVSSGETKGDAVMLKCDIEGCPRWYHLSCIQFHSSGNHIFQSQATGTKKCTFFCLECFNPKRKDLVEAVAQAELDFKISMERIREAITNEKEGKLKVSIPNSSQEEDDSNFLERDTLSLGMDRVLPPDFELANKEKYQGIDSGIVISLLKSIEDAVFVYDREISSLNNLLLDGNDVLKSNPLKAWDQVDQGQTFLSGKEWFQVDGAGNNLSQSHAPITAALRRMLKVPDDKKFHISTDLEDLSFSEVHTAFINWFIIDLLNNAVNLYHFPNMKPMRAMLSAVANFGDERWKGHGREVLREVLLRTWHKNEYQQQVVENIDSQSDIIRRIEDFLAPLTRKLGKINPRSESRAKIIKHAIELWTYLDAAYVQLEIINPGIKDSFDSSTCEIAYDKLQPQKITDMKVKWVLRRGFRLRELCPDGKTMVAKALVAIE